MDALFGASCLLLLAGLVALVVVVAVTNARRERERRDRLHDWAKRNGWTVVHRPPVDWGQRLPGGNRRGVSLALSGVLAGRQVSVGDYSYTETTTSSGPNGTTTTSSHTHHFVVSVVWLPRSYPPVAVQPRGALSRLGRTLFGDGAAATGHEEFDRRFRISTGDPGVVKYLFGPTLIMEQLAGRLPTWSVSGHELMTSRSGRLTDPEAIPALAAPALRVADLLGR